MNRTFAILFLAATLLVTGALVVSAQSSGPDKPTQDLEAAFGVTADQVSALQADGLGFGEINILLALAQTLPGGVTSDNIASVLAARQGPPVQGWGQVARGMGVNLGQVVSASHANGNSNAGGNGGGNANGNANGHAR